MARIVLFLVLFSCFTGCRAKPKPFPVTTAPTTRPIEVLKRPAVDLSRSGAGFPLEAVTPPDSIPRLIEYLRRGYQKRLTDDSPIEVEITGRDVNDLDRLNVILTGATVRPDYQPANIPEPRLVQTAVTVRQLDYLADPMHYTTYSGSMQLSAANVDLGCIEGSDKKLYLVITNCSTGSARIKIDLKDLEKGLVAGTRIRSALGIGLDSIELNMRSSSAQSLEANFIIHARVLMIPATFQLTGRADVNDDFQIQFTQLNARGNDPAGAMVAAIVQARLDKINNKAAPILKLPGDQVRITDFSIKATDQLIIDVQFSGTKK